MQFVGTTTTTSLRGDSNAPAGVPAAITVRLREDGQEVELRYVQRGASRSLMIIDIQAGNSGATYPATTVLDATELESLARTPSGHVCEALEEARRRGIDGKGGV